MKKIFSLVVALLTLASCSEDFLNLTRHPANRQRDWDV